MLKNYSRIKASSKGKGKRKKGGKPEE